MTSKIRKWIGLFILLLFITKTSQNTPVCDICFCSNLENKTTSINCDRKEVQNTIFKDINTSIPISKLSLQFNKLQTLQIFPRLKLKSLDLGHNIIRDVGKGVFSSLQEMEELSLDHNIIEVIQPDAFRGEYSGTQFYPLKSLKSLNLGHNKLRNLNEDLFEHIDELENLVLSGNPLKVIDAQTVTAITSLVNLKSLDLSSTQIQELPAVFLQNSKLVKVLDLSGNNFEGVPASLGEYRALETLHFDNNPISKITGENAFPSIPTLKVLHMSNMSKLEELGAYSLSGLENLKELNISNNKRLTSINPDFLVKSEEGTKKWPLLSKLGVEGNNISHISNNTIPNLNGLESLNLKGNPWVCDCENMWMMEALISMRNLIGEEEIKSLRCMYPLELRNKLLYEVRSELQCDEPPPNSHTLLLVATVAGILAGVACTLFLICLCRNRSNGDTLYEMKSGRSTYMRL